EDQPAPPPNNGLDVIARDCEKTRFEKHGGFQDAPRCVETEMGEVSAADKNPSLLIASAPRLVRVNKPFEMKISTRNLVRDRFLAAGAGGYYLETSVLTEEGLQRGHFHVSCRMLSSRRNAPNPEPVPAFFKAIEDSKGGAQPDTVTVQIPGLPSTGTAQCAAWAGDNTHRIPMMQRANQQPAFDVVRITVIRR
ncbi:MAG TPA: Pecanex-like protein 1, partial [Pilimelia sp.]|nr:Pecanex-like protein 1 [Pilimelia sp.]